MRVLASVALLGLALTGCRKSDMPTPASDQLTGHWQSETLEILFYSAAGQLVDDHTFQGSTQLDVTGSTLTTTQTVNGQAVVDTQSYTRNGEVLILSKRPAGFTCYCRNLSAAAFTLEYVQMPVAGQSYTVQRIAYHR